MPAQTRTLDALTSPTLKHVRDEWWDEAFTTFLVETLRPRVGNRILDVGCGTGGVEVRLARLRIPQVTFVGIIGRSNRALMRDGDSGHNLRASFSAADARQLPFPDATVRSTFCVAVLQHITELGEAVREFARVTRPAAACSRWNPTMPRATGSASSAAGMAAFAEARAVLRRPRAQPRRGPSSRESGRASPRSSHRPGSSRSKCSRSRCRSAARVLPTRRPGRTGGRRSKLILTLTTDPRRAAGRPALPRCAHRVARSRCSRRTQDSSSSKARSSSPCSAQRTDAPST